LLRGLFGGNIDPMQLMVQMLYFIPIALITMVVHECSHGYIAYKLGDPTAKMMGRLTPNPLKHLDPIGFIMMIVVGFGWAKPVPINPRYFKNPKKGMAISAIAGPASNIIMAIVGVIIVDILFVLANIFRWTNSNAIAVSAVTFFSYFAQLNVFFAVFNLIPVPPLDGSRIVNYFLSQRASYYYAYIERYGFIVMALLLFTGILSWPLQFISNGILNGIYFVIDKIFSLFGG